jgi:hypothetical protein
MPAQRDIDLMREWSTGCFGRLSWAGDLDSLASAIAAPGALEAEVRESMHYNGFVYLRITLPHLRGGDLTLEYEDEPASLILRAEGPDPIIWRLLDLFARRLHQLEISHEITVWDEMSRDADEVNLSSHQPTPG